MDAAKTVIYLPERLINTAFKLKSPMRREDTLFMIGHEFAILEHRTYSAERYKITDSLQNSFFVSENFLKNHGVLDKIYKEWLGEENY